MSKKTLTNRPTLKGVHCLTLGEDYRFTMPPAWRPAFEDTGQVWITRRDAGCWLIYPWPEWHKFVDGYSDRKEIDYEGTRDDFAMIAASACDPLDKRGRFLIAPALRDWVKVKVPFPAALVGLGEYAELWPWQYWEALQDKLIFEDDPAGKELMEISKPFLGMLPKI